MPLDNELAETLLAVRGLNAQRQDYIQDYFHDAIVHELGKGKDLNHWLGYIYKCVSKRIGRGREGPMDLSLEESIVPDKPTNLDLKIDIAKGFTALTPLQAQYIYEYFYEEYTLAEIAIKHRTSLQCVEKCINRGLATMKKVLTS